MTENLLTGRKSTAYGHLEKNEYYREGLFVNCYFTCEIGQEGSCLLTEGAIEEVIDRRLEL